MTRIYTFSFEQREAAEGRYMIVLVAERNSRRAARVAAEEVTKRGGRWRLVHTVERRTALRVPPGEILGVSDPVSFPLE